MFFFPPVNLHLQRFGGPAMQIIHYSRWWYRERVCLGRIITKISQARPLGLSSLFSSVTLSAFHICLIKKKKKKMVKALQSSITCWNFPYSAVQRRPSKSPVAFIHPLSVSISRGEVKVLCGDVKSKHTPLIFLRLACSYQQKSDLDAHMRPTLCISDEPSSPPGALISALGNVYGGKKLISHDSNEC